jgi:hypothetical protein
MQRSWPVHNVLVSLLLFSQHLVATVSGRSVLTEPLCVVAGFRKKFFSIFYSLLNFLVF